MYSPRYQPSSSRYDGLLLSKSSPRNRMKNVRNFVDLLFSNAINAAKDDDPQMYEKQPQRPYFSPRKNGDSLQRQYSKIENLGRAPLTSRNCSNSFYSSKYRLDDKVDEVGKMNYELKSAIDDLMKERKKRIQTQQNAYSSGNFRQGFVSSRYQRYSKYNGQQDRIKESKYSSYGYSSSQRLSYQPSYQRY